MPDSAQSKINRGLENRRREMRGDASAFKPVATFDSFTARHGELAQAYEATQSALAGVKTKIAAEYKHLDELFDRATTVEDRPDGSKVRLPADQRRPIKASFEKQKHAASKRLSKDALTKLDEVRRDIKATISEAHDSGLADPLAVASRYAATNTKQVGEHLAVLRMLGPAALHMAARDALSREGDIRPVVAALILANDAVRSADRSFQSRDLAEAGFLEPLDAARQMIRELEDNASRLTEAEQVFRGGTGSNEKIARGLRARRDGAEPADAA